MPYNYGFTNKFAPTFTPNLIPSNQNKKLFTSQPMRDTTLGPFNFNTPLPQQQPLGQSPTTIQHPQAQVIPGVNAPVNFAEQYAQINANRPNRLAYQKLATEGAPQIERGNWAKLGAVLAGAATGFGQNNATAGYNLGRSAYEAPQVRADEAYDRRIKELSNLANLEDSDATAKLSALEAQNRNYWSSEDLRLKNLESARADRGENRADLESAARIKQMAMENMITINETDGWTYLYDKGTGLKRRIGKTGYTTKEQYDNGMIEFAKQKEIEAYYSHQLATIVANTSRANNAATNATKLELEEKDRELAAANLRIRAASIPPNTMASNVVNGIAGAVSRGELPKDAGSYLQFDENGMPISKYSWPWGGNIGTEDSVRKYIGDIINGVKNPQVGGASTAPAVTPSSVGVPSFNNAPTTSPAAPVTPAPIVPSTTTPSPTNVGTPGIEGKSYPRNPDGTVPMEGPDGKFDADPAHVPELLKDPRVKVGYPSGLRGNTAPAPAPAPANTFRPNISSEEFVPYDVSKLGLDTPPSAPSPISREAAASNLSATAPPPTLETSLDINEPSPYAPTEPITAGRNIPNPITLSQPARIPAPLPQTGWSNRTSPPPVTPPIAPTQPGWANRTSPSPVVPPPVNPNPIRISPPATAPSNVAPAGTVSNVPSNVVTKSSMISPAAAEMNLGPSKFRSLLDSVMAQVEEKTGYKVKVSEGYRDAIRQGKLFAQGRTEPGKIVTNADGIKVKSEHQFDLAADLSFISPQGKTVKLDDERGRTTKEGQMLYAALSKAAQARGLTWGGDWGKPYDPTHVQFKPTKKNK